MKRLAVVAAATLALLAVTGPADAALTGTLTISDPTPSVGDVVTFDATVDGKVGRKQKVEVAVACVADGVMVLQGAVRPGQPFPLTFGPADCEAHLRVVEMVKSGVYVLDTVRFRIAA